jgi:hypothetical protein
MQRYSSMSHNTCITFSCCVWINLRELSWPKFSCSLKRRCSIVRVLNTSNGCRNICIKVMKMNIKVYHTLKVCVLLVLQIPLKEIKSNKINLGLPIKFAWSQLGIHYTTSLEKGLIFINSNRWHLSNFNLDYGFNLGLEHNLFLPFAKLKKFPKVCINAHNIFYFSFYEVGNLLKV